MHTPENIAHRSCARGGKLAPPDPVPDPKTFQVTSSIGLASHRRSHSIYSSTKINHYHYYKYMIMLAHISNSRCVFQDTHSQYTDTCI